VTRGTSPMRALAVLTAAALLAAACGKRGTLERPDDAVWPRTYPAPESVTGEDAESS